MGFLDKAKQAVSTAKGELDKSGLLDQVRGGNDTQPAAVPTHDETSDMIDSIRRGAVDPRSLLSREEVSAIAGDDVEPPTLGFNGDFVSVAFAAKRERYMLACFHNMDDERPWDAGEQWEFLRENVDDTCIDIADLGDEAYRQYGMVFAKAHDRVLYCEVSGDKLSEEACAIRAESMMRRAVNRLDQL